MIKASININLATKLVKDELIPLMEDIGNIVLEKVNANTPVRSGTLRDGNNVDVVEGYNGITATVFNDVEYAPFVEFGTVKMNAQPFLRTGLEDAKTEIQNLLGLQ